MSDRMRLGGPDSSEKLNATSGSGSHAGGSYESTPVVAAPLFASTTVPWKEPKAVAAAISEMPASSSATYNIAVPRWRGQLGKKKKLPKVDLKQFMCNERTTFQWLKFMTVYSMFAIGLVSKV